MFEFIILDGVTRACNQAVATLVTEVEAARIKDIGHGMAAENARRQFDFHRGVYEHRTRVTTS
jgi:predicted DNA-binding protein (UPF0251 family)